MERLSLPVRTVSTRPVVVIPATVLLGLLMLAWIVEVLYLNAAENVFWHDFRQVVMTGQPMRRFREGELLEERTLFQRGGRQVSLREDAERAFRMNTWNGPMRYLYARGLWREYNGPVSPSGRTAGGFVRNDLPGLADDVLRSAARCEPMNDFYRLTQTEVTGALKDDVRRAQVDRMLAYYAPQDTYGQVRVAEMLSERGADKTRILGHYARALELVSAEVTSGLVGPSPAEPGGPLRPLGQMLADRAVDGMLQNVGDYSLWDRSLIDKYNIPPEAHWMAAARLRALAGASDPARARTLNAAADQEYMAVVTSVQRRLTFQRRVSAVSSLIGLLLPISQADYTDRFIMNREIGEAAAVLQGVGRPDDAIALYRIQISRMPRNPGARLALGTLLLQRAEALTAKAREARAARNDAEARKLTEQAGEAYRDVDEQASAILREDPRSPDALNLRSRVPGRAGELPAP